MIRLLIVEDQPLMRRGLRTVLELEEDLCILGEATRGEEALEQARALNPDLILMDLRLPGMSGFEVIRQLAPQFRILVLTTFETERYVLEAIQAGARGYLLKDVEAEELCAIIRRVASGENFIQPSVAARYLQHLLQEPEDPLTTREQEVLTLLAEGKTNKEIARELGISESTVKNHVASILSKPRARNRVEAALKKKSDRGHQ